MVKLGHTFYNPEVKTDQIDTENEHDEVETDADVLSLPSVDYLAEVIGIRIPNKLSRSAELTLKRAVVSCTDILGDNGQ